MEQNFLNVSEGLSQGTSLIMLIFLVCSLLSIGTHVQNAGSCSTHSNCSLNCDFAQEHQIQGCVFKFIHHDDTSQHLAPVFVHNGKKELYELESEGTYSMLVFLRACIGKLFQQREDEELPSEMSNDSNKILHTEVATVQPGGAIGYAEKRCYWASGVKVVTDQRKVYTTKTVTFSKFMLLVLYNYHKLCSNQVVVTTPPYRWILLHQQMNKVIMTRDLKVLNRVSLPTKHYSCWKMVMKEVYQQQRHRMMSKLINVLVIT